MFNRFCIWGPRLYPILALEPKGSEIIDQAPNVVDMDIVENRRKAGPYHTFPRERKWRR